MMSSSTDHERAVPAKIITPAGQLAAPSEKEASAERQCFFQTSPATTRRKKRTKLRLKLLSPMAAGGGVGERDRKFGKKNEGAETPPFFSGASGKTVFVRP